MNGAEIHQPRSASVRTAPPPGAEADDAATDESLEDVRPAGRSSRWHQDEAEEDAGKANGQVVKVCQAGQRSAT